MNSNWIRKLCFIKDIWEELLNILYPENLYCNSCGALINNESLYGLCHKCIKSWHWNTESYCKICGRNLYLNRMGDICLYCNNQNSFFDGGISCFYYGKKEKQLIYDFKYGGKIFLGKHFSQIIYDRLVITPWKIDVIIPVPIHKNRLEKRGFNQSSELAKELSKLMGLEVVDDVLFRTYNTKPLKGQSLLNRKRSLEGAFKINYNRIKYLRGKNILLVDDILTTGATLEYCAGLIKKTLKMYFNVENEKRVNNIDMDLCRIYVATLANGGDFK